MTSAIDKSPFLCLFYTYNVTIINTDPQMIIRGSTTMKKPLAVLITAFSLSLGLTPAFTGISGNLIIEAEAQKQQPLRFLLVGRKMIMAGGTAFLQIPTMLTV